LYNQGVTEDRVLSRWQQFYRDEPKLGDILPSATADRAAGIFAEKDCRRILDLGCGAGRDTGCLASGGAAVVGLDAARSGLTLAKARTANSHLSVAWVESDSRCLPFSDSAFDGVYCFGLLHEFVGESGQADIQATMDEIYRVLSPAGMAVVATAAGDPEKGLPQVQNFSEEMFDAAVTRFRCIEKKVHDDLGCTGRTDYKVWYGLLRKE
jgi:ubiquinone/menaquinone biosynthesis C-methylase UbiE